MIRRRRVRVRVDGDLLREAREALGTRSNSQTAEFAMTIALAIHRPWNGVAQKYLQRLSSRQFRI